MQFNFASISFHCLCVIFITSSPAGSDAMQTRMQNRINYECGVPGDQNPQKKIILKILGGSNANNNQWPWMVYIVGKGNNRRKCGGTLITDRWILTAASCVERYYGSSGSNNYDVILGKYYHRGPRKNENEFTVVSNQVVLHPNYSSEYFYNVALLQISQPVNFSRYSSIRPACLVDNSTNTDGPGSPHSFVGRQCYALGWGLTEDLNLESEPAVLQQLNLTVWNESECFRAARGLLAMGGTTFCAGAEANHGTCNGDGGGPLLCFHNNDKKYYLHGIVVGGIECGLGYIPDFFAEVGYPNINNWIRSVVTGQ